MTFVEDPALKKVMVRYMGDQWYEKMKYFLHSEKMAKIGGTLLSLRKQGVRMFPPPLGDQLNYDVMFRAFRETPFSEVRVVILGQDPYHDGSADGLAFSNVEPALPRDAVKPLSPSLRVIFDEIEDDVYGGFGFHRSSDLSRWARQGVLLLNTALSVELSKPGSHADLWKPFTSEVLLKLSEWETGVVYLLWGKKAQAFKPYIRERTNFILEAGHPSPLNQTNPFRGCKHFSATNKILVGLNGPEAKIDW